MQFQGNYQSVHENQKHQKVIINKMNSPKQQTKQTQKSEHRITRHEI